MFVISRSGRVASLSHPLIFSLYLLTVSSVCAADPFEDQVLPFLKTYCVQCHNKKTANGELDLTRYSSASSVLGDFRQWEHVVMFLKKVEMPPPKAKQPPAEMRAKILTTLEQLLISEARKLAGDPGVVPPRRLSNAEFDYSIHDLTGVDIRPTASFPLDPASGEGFNNTGEALTMSPSLFKKYYGAAQSVAEHALLTSSGIRFAPHPVVTFADRQKYYEQAILRFYEEHKVDYEAYLTAAWTYKHQPAVRKTATIREWATEKNLSPKYLQSLWETLQGDIAADGFYLGWLRQRWNAIPTPKNTMDPAVSGEVSSAIRTLASEIRSLSLRLCPPETQAIISNAGNGPVEHLERRRRMATTRNTFDPRAFTRPPSAKENAALPKLNFVEVDPPNAKKVQASGEAFCRLFPNRFYFVDGTRGLSAGFHLIEGFFRDDQPLYNLVLTDPEKREIDRLWNELYVTTDIWHKMLRGFVFFERSERNFLKHPDFDSIREEDPDLLKDESLVRFKEIYLRRSGVKATGEELAKHPISIFFDDIRNGLKHRAETLKKAEPSYLKDLEDFARRAYGRPLTEPEQQQLRKFYREVNEHKDHGIEQAVQASIIRILVSPHFCFRLDIPPKGNTVAPLSDLALASRMSHFLWGSLPDEDLLTLAATGKLRDEKVLREQTRRMLKDPKVSRFALEFFGQWLGYREFLKQESVNRQVFPTFDESLRQAMFEEPTRLSTYLIQQNQPITHLLHGDKTFVNKKLAQHYELPFTGKANEWEMVDGLHKQGRGGLLGMAVFLTKNSQPQRTSPVKRGFWVVHKLLGEHIPAPPADVAVLPAKETDTNGKTIRQLLALHTEDNRCARCHVRFDPVGLSMEGFDPIGRVRKKDLAGRAVDNVVLLPSGKEARGVPEFSQHLLTKRKQEFTKTLCQKLLGYALGRSLQFSDHDLLEKMQANLDANEDRLATLFETVITSPQFRNQRCRDFTASQFQNERKGN